MILIVDPPRMSHNQSFSFSLNVALMGHTHNGSRLVWLARASQSQHLSAKSFALKEVFFKALTATASTVKGT